MIHVIVVCFKLELVSINFLKDFARFLQHYKKEEIIVDILIFDKSKIRNTDAKLQPFVQSDIGFHKGGTLSSVLSAVFPDISILSYSSTKKDAVWKIINQKCDFYSNSDKTENIIYFIDSCISKKDHETMNSLFDQSENAILASISAEKIAFGYRRRNALIKEPSHAMKRPNTYLQSLFGAHLLLSHICNFLTFGKLILDTIYFSSQNTAATMKSINYINEKEENREHDYIDKRKNKIIVCVGVGGTGGNFYKELLCYLSLSPIRSGRFSIVVIDGDHVETQNGKRQPFSADDMNQNKAIALMEKGKVLLSKKRINIVSYPHFIDDVTDLESAIQLGYRQDMENEIYLIGGVDNHRARQVMHTYFNESESIVYLDSANEFSNGEVVFSKKKDGILYSPLRSFYFPEVLTDRSPSASELSCGTVNLSFPQHLVTNLFAADILLSLLDEELHYEKAMGGIVYFDALSCFSRFQPIEKEVFAG